MEDILEVILSVLFAPFESRYKNLSDKINSISSKVIKVLLKILLILIPLSFIFVLCGLFSYLEAIGFNFVDILCAIIFTVIK